MSNFWNKTLLGFAIFLATALTAFAQPKDNSPYSRLGIGDLTDQFFAAQGGMGGLGAAFYDDYHMNIANPASLARLREAAFEVGLYSEYNVLTDATGQNEQLKTWNGNLRYLSLGFPLKNPINEVLDQKKKKIRWGMNFTLLPYSNVNYNIQTLTDQTIGDTLTSVNFSNQGSGGTYKIMWGNAVNIKNFSAGINLGYFFGKIENDKIVTFPDIQFSNDNFFTDDFLVGGFTWNLGVQYDHVLATKEDSNVPIEFITIGLSGNSRNKFNLTRNRFWSTRNSTIGTLDTILSVSGSETTENTGYLPGEVAIGVMYTKVNKMRFGVDFKFQSWSEYINDLVAAADSDRDNVNVWRLGIGGEYVPDARSYNKYLKKVRYRFGAFYSKDPRSIQDDHLLKYGATVGFGLPVILPQGKKSFVNLAFELGQIGLADALTRTYFKINLGFTLNDNTWFFKRKFN
ncbi:MAG: hypothetical protein ACJAT4_000765 [Granulosicoccus sp.]|jgi:hypothetical protein